MHASFVTHPVLNYILQSWYASGRSRVAPECTCLSTYKDHDHHGLSLVVVIFFSLPVHGKALHSHLEPHSDMVDIR